MPRLIVGADKVEFVSSNNVTLMTVEVGVDGDEARAAMYDIAVAVFRGMAGTVITGGHVEKLQSMLSGVLRGKVDAYGEAESEFEEFEDVGGDS